MADVPAVVSTAEGTNTGRDFRQEVTNQIIEMLERGTAPWQKPWEPGALRLPFNPTSNRTYRGGNALHLMAVATRKGYEDPRWLTYRQANENGWQVRAGERGTQIEFWQFGPNASTPHADTSAEIEPSDQRAGAKPIRRIYTVFNAQQIDGMPAYEPKVPQQWEVVRAGESILQNSGAVLKHDQHDRAFYNRLEDSVHLPRQEAFKTAADYYGTALHELAHWTGHPTRLNRPTLTDSYRFGDTNYAKEELRAELASVFLAAERGIPHNPKQHAAYVGSWIAALRDDKNEIFRAAREAHRAADFVLSLEKGAQFERPQPSQLRAETSEHVADLERGSSTVNIVEKGSATEHREPVAAGTSRSGAERDQEAKIDEEKILDGQVDGRKPAGIKASLYPADTESGHYRGEIIGSTEHHVLQRLNQRSIVAHPRDLMPAEAAVGQNVIIAYAGGIARVKPNRVREHAQALSR